jgi:hypothetical protein
MLNSIRLSNVFVLDQDEALDFYVGKLGLEVNTDADLGFMRWLTVSVPGDPDREILLERPGPPSMDDGTAEQVRELVTKGAAGWVGFTTDDCRRTYEELVGAASSSARSRPSSPTASTARCATRSATPSGSCSWRRTRRRPRGLRRPERRGGRGGPQRPQRRERRAPGLSPRRARPRAARPAAPPDRSRAGARRPTATRGGRSPSCRA